MLSQGPSREPIVNKAAKVSKTVRIRRRQRLKRSSRDLLAAPPAAPTPIPKVYAMTVLEQAQQYLQLGYNLLPLVGKVAKGRWEYRRSERMLLAEADEIWRGSRYNIGIVCGRISGGLYVVDFDDKQVAREHYRKHKSALRTIVETRCGVQFWFRADLQNSGGKDPDGRGEGRYVTAPPSVVKGWHYSFVKGHGLVPPEELCELPCELPGQPPKNTAHSASPRIRDGLAAITRIVSSSEEGGDEVCFRAATRLCESGMSEVEVFAALIEWNRTNAKPPLSHHELLNATREAFAKYMQKANDMIRLQDGCRDGSCDIGGRMG